jgi:hypothetical protein
MYPHSLEIFGERVDDLRWMFGRYTEYDKWLNSCTINIRVSCLRSHYPTPLGACWRSNSRPNKLSIRCSNRHTKFRYGRKGIEVDEPRTRAACTCANRRFTSTPRDYVVDLYCGVLFGTLLASEIAIQHLHHLDICRLHDFSTSVLSPVDHGNLYCLTRWHE